METVIIKIAQVVVAFALLIVLHEGGHFVCAKLFKIRVEKFYLFFDFPIVSNSPLFSLFAYRNKKFAFIRYIKFIKIEDESNDDDKKKDPEYTMDVFSLAKFENGKWSFCNWERGLSTKDPEADCETYHTEYGAGWLPLGGYVNITGMIDESTQELSSEPKPWEFRTKPAWQRLIVMLGGIIVNFITAFVIYIAVLFTWGESYIKPTDMTHGLKFSEAAIADGFRDGDIIVKTDDKEIKAWNVNVLRDISNADEVTILRDGQEEVLNMPAKMNMLDMIQSNPPYAEPLLPFCIDSIMPNSPAEQIGLKKGDVINAINGIEVDNFNEFAHQLSVLGEPLTENSTAADSLKLRTITLLVNNTDSLKAVLTPEFTLGFQNKAPEYKITNEEFSLLQSIPAGCSYGWEKLGSYVNDLKYLFTAQGAKSVSGVVGITNIFPDVWDWQKFWLLTALLSIALGVMNVLPIPALDGGHAVFAIYEIITRRKPSDKVLATAQYIGVFLLIALMIFATWNDITRLLGM